ncbi:hypothetical protein FE257_004398 [Aspergillus nanangensis]|uniref:Nucleoside phosphorylase domain-containing protein n=1 Tax=Aspergillus nanangensis TaxID=2582783 RepID=A0AAD4GZ73_ASPNN|nr:hypothetical protein FE257_004398 [Aspergillus nanangensis]
MAQLLRNSQFQNKFPDRERTTFRSHNKQLSYKDYTVGVICALEFELKAVRYMLDDEHASLPSVPGDPNVYVLGRIGSHNIVMACLPGGPGKATAAIATANMARTFPEIRLRLLVGTGGGVPSVTHDIRLGDVVISMPDGPHGGVVEYDMGSDTEEGFNHKGNLLPVPSILRSAVVKMRSNHRVKPNKIHQFLSAMLQKGQGLSTYQRPSMEPDVLFQGGYPHISGHDTCGRCDKGNVVNRPPRNSNVPHIHYGLIASGDQVMRSARERYRVTRDIGDVLCFEMEAAGILAAFPCLVIRGISNYADSHKTDVWRHYAAATAAGCAKELLLYLS